MLLPLDISFPADLQAFVERVEAGEIPEKAPESCYNPALRPSSDINSFWHHPSARQSCTDVDMWAIVDLHWTKQLADWIGDRTILEVMAGAGWLSEALKRHGTDVIATDNLSWETQRCKLKSDVLQLDAIEAVKQFQERDVLLVSWSPYEDEIVNLVCEHWNKPIIYIGEESGCNVPDSFFERFEVEDSVNLPLPTWRGIHDKILIGEYF